MFWRMFKDQPHLKIYLFGAPRVELDGNPVALHRSKALALLAYLCMEPVPHTRDQVIDLLWPLFSPEDARNNLRRELSLLKKYLELDVLEVDRLAVGINLHALQDGRLYIDVQRFLELIDSAAYPCGKDDHLGEECIAPLEAASNLYVSDFLAGFSLPDSPAFDEWQFFQVERLRRIAAGSLAQLIAYHRQVDEFDMAITYARHRLAIDPLHEPAHRELMQLYALSGQQAAALRQFEVIRQLLREELDLEPEPETSTLYDAIRTRQFERQRAMVDLAGQQSIADASTSKVKTARAIPHNLPADTTPFIGRDDELENLRHILADGTVRLVTIMGVGGMGKTRLALALARGVLAEESANRTFPDGIFFVPLATVTKPEGIVATLALFLGITLGSEGQQIQQLEDYLRDRHMLILLDNFEHLVGPQSQEILHRILTSAPNVKVVATSRIRLGFAGEQLYPLEGLSIPAGSDNSYSLIVVTAAPIASPLEVANTGAVSLFVTAGQRVRPEFRLTEENLSEVVRICSLVQGMPLGIELAAGWLNLLQPGEIRAEIERNLDFLEADWSDKPERHVSLRAVFDSSWRLLSKAEQQALVQLTIFRGGFTRQAAEQVTGLSLRTLMSLTNKSWLQNVASNRYSIHDLLHRYALNELINDPNIGQGLEERYACYYADYLNSLLPSIKSDQPALAFGAITSDLDNIQASMTWLVENNNLKLVAERMMPALFHFLESRFHFYLLEPILDAALVKSEQSGPSIERAIFLIIRFAFIITGFPTRFLDYSWLDVSEIDVVIEAQKSLPANPEQPIAFWSVVQGWHYGRMYDIDKGVDSLKESLQWFIHNQWLWEAAFAKQNLGRLLMLKQSHQWSWEAASTKQNLENLSPLSNIENSTPMDDTEARDYLIQSKIDFERLGDQREAAISQFFLGLERTRVGNYELARDIILEAQERLRALGEEIIAANAYWQLAEIHLRLGDIPQYLSYLHQLGDFMLGRGRQQLAILGYSRQSYETVRYGDIDEAIRLREITLEISHRINEAQMMAWDYLELGEAYRVKGDHTKARQWFEKAMGQFTVANFPVGFTFYFRGLGDLALTERDFPQAEDQFISSIEWAQLTHHPWQEAYALSGASKAALRLGNNEKARSYLVRSLRIVLSLDDLDGMALMVLAAAAELFSYSGDMDRAKTVAEFILSHTLTWNETRRWVEANHEIFRLTLGDQRDNVMMDLAPILIETLQQLEELSIT